MTDTESPAPEPDDTIDDDEADTSAALPNPYDGFDGSQDDLTDLDGDGS